MIQIISLGLVLVEGLLVQLTKSTADEKIVGEVRRSLVEAADALRRARAGITNELLESLRTQEQWADIPVGDAPPPVTEG